MISPLAVRRQAENLNYLRNKASKSGVTIVQNSITNRHYSKKRRSVPPAPRLHIPSSPELIPPNYNRYIYEEGKYINKPPDIDRKTLHKLSPDQAAVVDDARQGRNIFLTGEAGSGKSEVLRHIKVLFEDLNRTHWVTATTGLASLLINGLTLHLWAQMGTANSPWEKYVERFCRTYGIVDEELMDEGWIPDQAYVDHKLTEPPRPWALIIDEVSMVGYTYKKMIPRER